MTTGAKHILMAAGFDDAQDVFNLIKKYPEELVPRSISDIVQNIDRFIVCKIDGHLVGVVSWQILPEIGAPKSPTVEIKSLAVEKEHQRKGIGTELVLTVMQRIALFHPAQIIILTFSPEFFAKLGFEKVPKETLMHKIYLGCANCTKYDSPFTCPEIAMAKQPPFPKTDGLT
ncbi:MAG: GNAT family N-acetyltransferase [Lentisphaerae bacterium]|nr:GNAT family N-acetyltransferase [Lentisphaerota bacterium]